MAGLPDSSPSAASWYRTTTPLSCRLPWLLGLGAAAGLAWFGADHLARTVFDHWKPRLERQLSQVLGHPLQLGPYQGIGLSGLQVGPSSLGPGAQDRSEARVAGLGVALDPFASLQRWTPVLDLQVRGAEADLRRNARGQYWVLGSPTRNQKPPSLELRINLADPAQLRIAPAGVDLRLGGRVGLMLQERRIDLSGRLQPAEGPGLVAIEAGGRWDRQRWQAQLNLQRLPVNLLQRFTPLQGHTTGQLDGRLVLALSQGRPSCRGAVSLKQLRWRPPGASPGSTTGTGKRAATDISSPTADLRCEGDSLVLERSIWGLGGWSGSLAGRAHLPRQQVSLSFKAQPPRRARGSRTAAALPALPALQGTAAGRWSRQGLAVSSLQVKGGRSQLSASGRVGPLLALNGTWRLDPSDLPLPPSAPSWLTEQTLAGSLQLSGTAAAPALAVQVPRLTNPLTGDLRASLVWRKGLLRLDDLRGPYLQASGQLPLQPSHEGGLRTGPLEAQLQLTAFPLQRLDTLVGTSLRGELSASGRIHGPLQDLSPDLDLELAGPGAGPLSLSETWQGQLKGTGAGASALQMQASTASGGSLKAGLDRSWMPVALELTRGGGTLTLTGRPSAYRWQASAFPLQGLTLALGPRKHPQPLQGELSGDGNLALQPLAFGGWVTLAQPVFLGVRAQELQAGLRYADRRYRLTADLEPLAGGSIAATLTGRWQGAYRAQLEGRGLTTDLFRQLAQALPLWRGEEGPPQGNAADLGDLVIDQLGGSLQDQLIALQRARERLNLEAANSAPEDLRERLAATQALVDTDLTLSGPNLAQTHVDLSAKGHLWLRGTAEDQALALDPFVVSLQGPIRHGEGSFDLASLPLSLLALLTPVPGSLQGSLSAKGRYRLGNGQPELEAELALHQGHLGEADLQLERGSVLLKDGFLDTDLALRAAGATSAVDFTGRIPLDPQAQGLEVRLASRGDGLRFLTTLAGSTLDWKKGSADMQLLVRGSLADPIANGFLRLREGELRFIGQTVTALEATMLFDFQELLLQELTARVGEKGQVEGKGKLGLVRPVSPEPSLTLTLKQVPFKLQRIDAFSDGQLAFGGSLRAPLLGGNLAIRQGSVNVQPGQVAAGADGAGANQSSDGGESDASKPAAGANPDVNELLQRNWAFDQPLVLLGPEVDSSTSDALRKAIPNFPYLRFRDLTLRLGPDLKVTVPNVASFSTGGSLRLNGPLDPSLQAAGVVRLLGGRLNLFTTSFNLDPDAPNVAVFTPSLGLLPYLDIALRTRVSENLSSNLGANTGSGLSLAELEAQGGFSSFNQLKLVRITVSVSGPADRIAENLRLTSDPPLPEERLVALIGGNSLAGLSGGNAGAALATALGQSLLSPLLGSLSDAFGQRVSFALYPTYVSPVVSQAEELRSRQLPPQLVLGSEIGLDITERFNAAVLVAPNRSDIPPQVTLNYKASENINLQGSFDTQGAWQTQMQLFFRF
ncbi:translocation/assembly module TamB domain-containing protein [Synechococcus sp. CBW1006]|uniref:translocation/assembly module TamB domain-containing protein n=1 Tax=Synechococcus sp. CBW1006 TaxID=1353138 RepID=UPI0018CD5162|nr:translocation/assembly module TamB domain-containing protein [Synechococcus sp. CBW1006]QPN66102.1 translocation/assembly module TamB domain-containing protein [Synechococcus sp. CBW1006]